MNYKSSYSAGAIHPVLFSVLVYLIVLFIAFFICNAVYNNLNSESAVVQGETQTDGYALVQAKTHAAYH